MSEDTTLIDAIVKGMQDVKAQDIVCLDLRNTGNAACDYFVICHGESDTQVSAIADSIQRSTKELANEKPWRSEGQENKEWILLDYVNIVAHVFYRETRSFYDLEGLWADAKITEYEQV